MTVTREPADCPLQDRPWLRRRTGCPAPSDREAATAGAVMTQRHGGLTTLEPQRAEPVAAAPRGLLSGRAVVVAAEAGAQPSDLSDALERAGCATQAAVDVVDARRSLTTFGPRALVVVVVLSPPHWLRTSLPALSRQDAVVVSTTGATSRQRAELLTQGADAVVCAGDAHEVVAALSAVVRRAALAVQVPSPDLICAGDVQVHLSARTATAGGRTLRLTSLEFDLLAYFVRRAGEALSRERLLCDVWGYDVGSLDTVTVHVRRLRSKLEQDPSRPVRLQTVWGCGYRLAADVAAPLSATLDLSA